MLELNKGNNMKLNRIQILEIFNTEKIAKDNIGVYNIHFDKLLDKLSISNEENFNIYSNYNKRHNKEISHLDQISQLLENKIEIFSNDFWELLFFRKHAYSSEYHKRKWNEFNECYEDVKVVNRRSKILKKLLITPDELSNFFTQLTYIQDGYIDLWFSLKIKNKDTNLTDEMKIIILNYGQIDPNEVKKAQMLSYFKEVNELEKLYEKNKDTPYRKEIEYELLKFKTIEKESINLFNESDYHEVVYRKKITINENALTYNFHKEKEKIPRILNIICNFLNEDIYQLKQENIENKYIFTLEGYSEDNLKEKIEIVKKATQYLPELLLKDEYIKLFKDDLYINNEMKIFFKQYIKSKDMYKNLNEKFPEQNSKEKKNKI